MKKHPVFDMAYMTPADVLVHVLKNYGEDRNFPADRIKQILANSSNLDCIHSLATGRREVCVEYEANKARIVDYIKDEIAGSFHPRFVVSPPSRRPVARDLAASLARVYECTDLSEFFFKRDPCLRAGERGIAIEVFAKNLVCTAELKCLQDGDSVLIVDDVLSTGLSIDSMKAKIVEVSGAEGILFMGAAVLKV
jgi:hypothetical protein